MYEIFDKSGEMICQYSGYGNLDLINTAIELLPDNMVVRGNLLLSYSTILCLPNNLTVMGNLEAMRCLSLQKIGKNLIVHESLLLKGDTGVAVLPSTLTATRIFAFECKSLIEVHCHVVEELVLTGCTSLKKLPDNLHVISLKLDNCASLEVLPKNLWIDNALDISGCTSLRELPSDLRAKEIYAFRCTGLLGDVPNGVYTSVSVENRCIIGRLDICVIDWCKENDIVLSTHEADIKPYSIKCMTIDDPAQLMHYRLRWQ